MQSIHNILITKLSSFIPISLTYPCYETGLVRNLKYPDWLISKDKDPPVVGTIAILSIEVLHH